MNVSSSKVKLKYLLPHKLANPSATGLELYQDQLKKQIRAGGSNNKRSISMLDEAALSLDKKTTPAGGHTVRSTAQKAPIVAKIAPH